MKKLMIFTILLACVFSNANNFSMDSSTRDDVVEQYRTDDLSKLIVTTQKGNIDVGSWDEEFIQVETCKYPLEEKYRSHLYSAPRRDGTELSIEGTIEPYTEVIPQPSTSLQQGLGSFHEDEFGNLKICGTTAKKLVFKGGGKCRISTAMHHTVSNGRETTTYGPGTIISHSGGDTSITSLSRGSIEKTITDLGHINYKVTLPHLAALALMLKTKSGNIVTEHIRGPQELDAMGNIRVVDAHQAIKAKGNNLDIHQADDAQGKISATAEGGSRIRNFAQKLKVKTSKGDLQFYRNPRNTTGKAKI